MKHAILQVAEKLSFVSGHDLSRAVERTAMRALVPELFHSCPVQSFPQPVEPR